MTAKEFRRIALGMADAIEGAHMGHPDFRVRGGIFATLHPDDKHGMVKLPPDEQQRLVRDFPEMFTPENGAWGRQGCTRVTLAVADEETLGEAMTLAWQEMIRTREARATKKTTKKSRQAPARPAGQSKQKRSTRRPGTTRKR
jgi:YjbR protein